MTLSHIIALLKESQDPKDWKQIVNDDGTTASYCVNDVLLRNESKVVWKQMKPFIRFVVSYGPTALTSFDLPVGAADHEHYLRRVVSTSVEELTGRTGGGVDKTT